MKMLGVLVCGICLCAPLGGCASGMTTGEPLTAERAELLRELEAPGGGCGFYADFGRIRGTPVLLRVEPGGQGVLRTPRGRLALHVDENSLSSDEGTFPVRLQVHGSNVEGVYGTENVRFGIEQKDGRTIVRLKPMHWIAASDSGIEVSAPGVSLSATEREPGLLTGSARRGDEFGDATVRLAACDLSTLRREPQVMALLLITFSADRVKGWHKI